VILGFRREVDENCVLLGYYAAGDGNSVPTIRDNQSVPSSGVKEKTTIEDGTDRLSLNVGKELPLLAAYQPRKVQFSVRQSTYWHNPEHLEKYAPNSCHLVHLFHLL